jgi:hypothetical protein
VAVTLRRGALALAVAAAALLFGPVWADSGAFAVWGLGLPVLLCVAPVVAAESRVATAVTWVAAVALLTWSILLALGVGLFLLPAAVVELAAAVTRTVPGRIRV